MSRPALICSAFSFIWAALFAAVVVNADGAKPIDVVIGDDSLNVPRGFPLYFGSFEDVGEGEIEPSVLSATDVDRKLTGWTKGCPSDAYILVRDEDAFALTGYKRLQRLAEQSLTHSSFLTDKPIDVHEFSLDLEEYCDAEYVLVDVKAPENVTSYIDTRPRVFYINFRRGTESDQKDLVMNNVLRSIPSPFVTVIYTSDVPQTHPMLRSIKLNPKRLSWSRKKDRHQAEKIAPVIAPLFPRSSVGHGAPEPSIEIPDNLFRTLLVASVMVVVFLAYRDYHQ